MDIIIFSGQSNMQGQTSSRPNTKPVSGAYEFLSVPSSLEPLSHPVGEDLGYGIDSQTETMLLGAHKKHGCLVPSFCKEYLKARESVTAIHAARGGTTIDEWMPGTNRYNFLVNKCLSGINCVKSKYKVEHIYFVWLQGESDALEKKTKKEYLANLISLKNSLKKDLGIEKFGIIRVGYFFGAVSWYPDIPLNERKHYDEIIMKAQESAVKQDEDFIMLTRITSRLSLDPKYISTECEGHFNNEALDLIGKRAGRTLSKATNASN